MITLHFSLNEDKGLAQWREIVKLQLRAVLNRQASFSWLHWLNADPLGHALVKLNPRLLVKIYRPYLSSRLSCRQRLAVLQAHYRFVTRQGWSGLTLRASQAPVLLGQVVGKSGLSYGIELTAIAPLEREGELVLRLVQGSNLIYSTAFTFFDDGAQAAALAIGCMQDPPGGEALALIRDTTRDLHGLRPVNLMVRLLSSLGHDHGCHQLLLVSNANFANHRAANRGKIFADYDALWREMGAQQRADGDYQLGCEAPRPPDLSRIASNKRSEARKRFDTLLALTDAVTRSLRQTPR